MRSVSRLLALALMLAQFTTAAVIAERIDPGRATSAPGDSVVWYDFQLLTVEGKGWRTGESFYDRLPAKAKEIVPPSVWGLGHHSSGICARFTTDAPLVQVRWTVLNKELALPHMPATGVSGVDLYSRDAKGVWRFVQNGRPLKETNTAPFAVKPGAECLLYLPLYNGVTKVEVGIPPDKTLSTPEPSARDRKKPVVFYGTSITHGACASRPGMSFTAIAGRMLDTPVINLGFSGSGKMEPAMGDLLAELDPSVYVLDCIWNMTPQMVSERVEPFVRKLREARPDTPILLAEDCNFREISPTEKGRILRDVYAKLKKNGVKKLYFLANRGMMGDDWDGTVDACHPNDLGMMRQAEVFAKALRKL